MDIWKALPPETNTLYVVKVPDPPVGEVLRWTPDPGVRCKVYGFACEFCTCGVAPARYPRWELWSGGEVIAGSGSSARVGPNSTALIRSTVGVGYFGFAFGDIVQLPGLGETYLIHGIELVVLAVALDAGDEFLNMRLYIDTWHDMTVRTP